MFKDDEKHETCYCESCLELQQKLQAKEQECEHLKRYENLFIKAREIYSRILKTNKQIIDENEDLKDTIKKFTCQAECYKHKKAEKFKQALDEIKKLSTNAYCLTNGTDKDMSNFAKQILYIINKVKEQ